MSKERIVVYLEQEVSREFVELAQRENRSHANMGARLIEEALQKRQILDISQGGIEGTGGVV